MTTPKQPKRRASTKPEDIVKAMGAIASAGLTAYKLMKPYLARKKKAKKKEVAK